MSFHLLLINWLNNSFNKNFKLNNKTSLVIISNEIDNCYTQIVSGDDNNQTTIACEVKDNSLDSSDKRVSSIQLAFDGTNFKVYGLKNGIWTVKKLVVTD